VGAAVVFVFVFAVGVAIAVGVAVAVVVEPEALEAAVETALSSIGIINEIATAKQSYADAEVFLAQVKAERDGADTSPKTDAN